MEEGSRQLEGFYTLKGYDLAGEKGLTAAMEDYLEMLWRMTCQGEEARLKELARRLHVKPSSASRMMTRLRESGYVDFQRYGAIFLTERGRRMGEYLLLRHQVVHQFLCWLNHSQEELEQAEKVEHFLNVQTVWNLKVFLEEQGIFPKKEGNCL